MSTHYFLPPCIDNTVLPIYETEISSFVAYTLMSPQYRQAVSDITAKELNKEVGSSQLNPPISSNNTNVNNVDQNDEKDTSREVTAADTSQSINAKETLSSTASEAPNKERDEILKGLTTSFNSTVDCSTYD